MGKRGKMEMRERIKKRDNLIKWLRISIFTVAAITVPALTIGFREQMLEITLFLGIIVVGNLFH